MDPQDFNVGSFTNVTLKYPDEDNGYSEIKCHKAILSWRSERFRAMLEKEDSPQVDGHTVLELGDDEEYYHDDMQAIIRYIYTGEYEVVEEVTGCTHLLRARFGNFYSLPEMEQKALAALEDYLANATVHQIAWTLGFWNTLRYESERANEIIRTTHERHFDKLIDDPFLAHSTSDKAIMQECLRRINLQTKLKMHCGDCGVRGILRLEGPALCKEPAVRKEPVEQHNWRRDGRV